MAKNSDAEQLATRQHYRLATGHKSVEDDHKVGKTDFKKGGEVHKDTTEYQKYGNGFRRKGK
jgi:hypothetical protein